MRKIIPLYLILLSNRQGQGGIGTTFAFTTVLTTVLSSLPSDPTSKATTSSPHDHDHGHRETVRFGTPTDDDGQGEEKEEGSITEEDSTSTISTSKSTATATATSKREMLSFAIPALGIFLSAPLLSNIDNAFVGRTVGTSGLAALSPATICTDQMLYLFSFLSRATTGIVSRAYAVDVDVDVDVDTTNTNTNANTTDTTTTDAMRINAAQKAASTPLTVAIFSGIGLSILYSIYTPKMLKLLNVNPTLHKQASSYIYWRGSIAWAALTQNVALSIMLATRDTKSPLKIITLAAVVNVIGDTLLCVYPFRWGCAGAAAATSFATLFSSFFMLRSLSKKQLLPPISKLLSIPKMSQLKELFDYVGPLFVIVISRLIGFMSMQRAAMRLGLQSLAGYQICVNCLIFFLLFGEPLSQLHQTKLPSLIDSKDSNMSFSTIKSVLSLGCYAALGVSSVAFLVLVLGTGSFTSDAIVQNIIRQTAPSVSIAIGSAILATTIDGAMLASRDFSFILILGVFTCIMQVFLASRCTSLTAIFLSFALRLSMYSICAVGRVALGYSALGKVLKGGRRTSKEVIANTTTKVATANTN